MRSLAEPRAGYRRGAAGREQGDQQPRLPWSQVPRYHVVVYHWPWCAARWGYLRDCDCEVMIGVEPDEDDEQARRRDDTEWNEMIHPTA